MFEKKDLKIASIEAFGVFILCFFGGLSIMSFTEDGGTAGYSPQLAIAVIHGLALYIGIAVAAPISGGHINPAVSLALFLAKKININELIVYTAGQTAGSFGAGFLLMILQFGLGEANPSVGLGDPNAGHFRMENGKLRNRSVPFILEFLGTFLLVSVVFSFGVHQKYSGDIVGKAVGTTVVISALSIGNLNLLLISI